MIVMSYCLNRVSRVSTKDNLRMAQVHITRPHSMSLSSISASHLLVCGVCRLVAVLGLLGLCLAENGSAGNCDHIR